MGRLSRHLGAPLAVLALLLGAAACGGGADQPDTKRPAAASGGEEESAAPAVVKTQRWPRYWATIDNAESGSNDSLSTAYFAGYDDTSVVYTGQDVIRFLDRETGKQRRQVILKHNRLVCSSQPTRQIENGLVLIGTGVEGVDTCDTVEAYDSATGQLRWTYGGRGKGDDMVLAQRDGVVLYARGRAAGAESAGLLVALDATTGRVLWRKTAADYFFGRPAKKDDDCSMNAALAADRAVVIAFIGCSDFETDKMSTLYGIDLETGEQTWETPFWDKPEDFYFGDGDDIRPHIDDGRTILQSDKNTPVHVDSETGEVTRVTEPAPRKIDGDPFWWPVCDDFRSYGYAGGGEHSDTCAFTNGDQVVFARDMSFGPKVRMRVEGVDSTTGKSLWVWDQRLLEKPKKYEYHSFQFLGFNADRSEFWVLRDETDVIRLDTKTGKRVGQGLAAPPVHIANFALAGPKFMLTRTSGGITNPDGSPVKSGLNFYMTDAE